MSSASGACCLKTVTDGRCSSPPDHVTVLNLMDAVCRPCPLLFLDTSSAVVVALNCHLLRVYLIYSQLPSACLLLPLLPAQHCPTYDLLLLATHTECTSALPA